MVLVRRQNVRDRELQPIRDVLDRVRVRRVHRRGRPRRVVDEEVRVVVVEKRHRQNAARAQRARAYPSRVRRHALLDVRAHGSQVKVPSHRRGVQQVSDVKRALLQRFERGRRSHRVDRIQRGHHAEPDGAEERQEELREHPEPHHELVRLVLLVDRAHGALALQSRASATDRGGRRRPSLAGALVGSASAAVLIAHQVVERDVALRVRRRVGRRRHVRVRGVGASAGGGAVRERRERRDEVPVHERREVLGRGGRGRSRSRARGRSARGDAERPFAGAGFGVYRDVSGTVRAFHRRAAFHARRDPVARAGRSARCRVDEIDET